MRSLPSSLVCCLDAGSLGRRRVSFARDTLRISTMPTLTVKTIYDSIQGQHRYLTSLTIIPPRLWATKIIGSWHAISLLCQPFKENWVHLIIYVALESNPKVAPVSRYAVLVIRLEQTPNDVRIVSVCPYSCLRNILSEIFFGPEDLLRS